MKKKYQTALAIYFAMISSLVVYTVLVLVLKNNGQFQAPYLPVEKMTMVRSLFFVLTVINFFAIRFLRKMMLVQTVIDYQTQVAKTSHDEYSTVSVPLVPDFLPIEFVTLAICEAVAVYGLVLFLLGKRPEDFFMFLGFSLVLFILYFPKYSQWQEWEARLSSK
ncbi:MAG: hypothetical protein WA705_29375 [Candidatus Ozemobacteraceae bacterium]